jgi:uncharacterized protein (DUF58 family)
MLISPELITRLAPLEVKAREIVEGFISGLHRSPFYGFSVEFAEHRPYNFGDELRHIDWKVWGKTERFYVKQYEAETNLRCQILFDVSSSMDFRYFGSLTKKQYGVYLSAAFLYLMHRQRDAVGLTFFSDEIHQNLAPKSAESHIRTLYSLLEPHLAEPENDRRKTASADAIHQIAEQLKHRSLVVIVSDLFENVKEHSQLIDALKHLRHKRHEVVLFNLMEKRSERLFDIPDRNLVLEDLESDRTIEIQPAQVRSVYRQKMLEYTDSFKNLCNQTRIDFTELDTEGDYDLGLLSYLNKRSRM